MSASVEAAAPSLNLPINIAEAPVEFSGSMGLFIDAAIAFGVDLEDQEREDWLMMGRAVHIIDQYVDEEKADIMPYVSAILAGTEILGISQDFQDRCREYMQRQSENRQTEIIKKLGQVSTLVEQQETAETIRELMEVRQAEADLMANLLALSSDGRPDETQRSTFNTWLVEVSRTGYLIDSFRDLGEDYDSGKIIIKPNLGVKAAVGTAALKQTIYTVAKTPPKVISKAIKVGIKNQILRKKPDLADPNQLI